ncbi:bifunctional phosphopantothenoylcysteine decarboxylase/phosphopantothenate synthase [Rhodomicrobium vannielii ATCC 17100]|uniref:bifunctional phosphopantothenoylcysteine decarboxylase/phosphopantothenate synthase n=1 Tax=Rhodomicrobium vannielii TaxID=1069 RepID=UPI00191AAF70|nr:phosphopantothenoylcysteine decarboxylase [Rhodomicrobium vannielii]MBJ7535501.1 bifunctional phosphopantothenoylcysteine decarboxylase/phosphopantothenate synthase [Rhodomicrobium vannielii ATCC 17100]
MHGRSILLIIGGGIAAYKCLDFIRRARERGAKVRCVLTRAAQEFVTPLSVAVLSDEPAFTELFDLKNETEIGHIRLSREADLIIVAPATANLLAKMAHGIADDLASTVILAGDKPILAAPAMNWRMWTHPATRRNLAQLAADGVRFVGPNEGGMACGEWGVGRMAEVDEIISAASAVLREDAAARPSHQSGPTMRGKCAGDTAPEDGASSSGELVGRHVLVTAGPTYEPLDPVRFIGNRSSGKQGYAIAAAAARLGARVTLVAGPTALPDPKGVATVHVETARDMFDAVDAALPADIAVFAAAVADWRAASVEPEKIKKGEDGPPQLHLVENPDILKTVASRGAGRPPLVIGFAAETGNAVALGSKKLASKGADWIVANDVSPERGIFGGDHNEVHVIRRDGVESWPALSKEDVALRLMRAAAEHVGASHRNASQREGNS